MFSSQEKAPPEAKLKVGELTARDDFGRGLARIDSNTMKAIGVKEGDVVEIAGKRTTVAIVIRSYPADVGLNLIRMDGLVRKNAGTGIGETVSVKKAEAKEAKKIVLAPAEKGIMLHVSPNLLKQNIFMRPMLKADIIIANPVFRPRGRGAIDPFEQMFGVSMGEVFLPLGAETKLIVVKTNPDGPVQITDMTEVELLPEAVEIEETRVPTVTYEDIGGIGDAVQKVREMIELPLKHPEVFERLGVDAPKGVLLHGSPGCGKTLLAKAVANESGANFISVAGPEVVSKWYGGSLPHDEKIVISENGKTKFVKIGELVHSDNYDGKKALAFDHKGKIIFAPIKGLILHPNDLKMFEIKTRSGRSIRVTESHSLFTLSGTKIVSVKTKELEPGKSYVAVPSKIPVSEIQIEKINLLELLKEKDYGLLIRNKDLLKACVEKLGAKNSAKILGCREKYIYDIVSKNVGVRVSKFLKLCREAGLELKPNEIEISTKFKSIPALQEISNELCEFLGLWTAEGSYNYEGTNSEAIRVSLNVKEIDYYKKICEKLFGSVSVYRKAGTKGADIYISNRAFSSVMRALGFEAGSLKKKIPEIIFSLPKERISFFLKGCFSGDGSIYPNQRGVPTAEYSTRSRQLASDIMYLLLYFGIVSKVYSSKQKDGITQRVCFTGAQNLSAFKEIGFVEAQKNLLIENYLKSVKWERSAQIPLTAEMKNIVSDKLPNWAGSATIGSSIVETLDFPELSAVAQSDIYWDLVEEICEVDCKDKYVYDISVGPCENFVGGFGGIFAHNSEENLRKIFEEAQKNAPTIIFFDEIDAIAPKREEVSGEVERRMVSQLLALMDGLKSRGKVIVIAATNRPNALDPALRRGGRFDREIEIPVPDKKGRKEVLQIHTRHMPLEKDVDVDKLAEITYGFVGADLAALAKEAAMHALRRVLPDIQNLKEDEQIPTEVLEKLRITKEDFDFAMRNVQPSAMREVLIEIPKVKWADVGGLEDVKGALKEAVEWPLKNPESFKNIGIKPPRGILLFGPPGCGKTMIAKAVANEAGVNFIAIKGPELLSKWVGESEQHIRDVFRRAKQVAPAIIFFDEIDSLAPRRGSGADSHVSEQVVSQLLTEMSGIEDMEGVVVLAASVVGDTPIMIKDSSGIKIIPISEFVDKYYSEGEEGKEKPVYGVQCLGFEQMNSPKFTSGMRFGNSAFKNVRGAFRHKVNEIYEIEFIGGKVRTTGNHSVFIRTRNGIKALPVSSLKEGNILVDLPYNPRIGKNIRAARAHIFDKQFNLRLPVFEPDINLQQAYDFATGSPLSQHKIAEITGFNQATISNWKRAINVPRGLSKKYFKHSLPDTVQVSLDLMRLFGYYVAEGFARKEVDFCFNSKENNFIEDVKKIVKENFGLEPDAVRNITQNATNIIYYSKPLADFFVRYCGKGAHAKHVPTFLFGAPFEYFKEFLKGYADGDGYTDKKGRLQITSVSKQLIVELNWLCRMHGIKSTINKFVAKAGRRVKGGKPLPETTAYRLHFGRTNNPFSPEKSNIKRAIIKSIKKVKFDGYVYDLCGCDNEAFFGGDTPVLLHNTNRPDIIDSALLRPGRFDRQIYVPAPAEKTRLQILKTHTRGMKLDEDVNVEKIAERTEGYSGADLEAVVREAGLNALRENISAKDVSKKHFEDALKKIKASITDDMFVKYVKAVEELQKAKLEEKEKSRYIG